MKFPFFKRSKPSTPTGGQVIRAAVINPGDAKVMRAMNRRMMRMYDAAISNNLNADFPVNISSANAEILTSVSNTRSRGRTLERDAPYANDIIRIYQDNVCGNDPFPLEMKVGEWVTKGTPDAAGQSGQTFKPEVEVNREIEEAWEEAGQIENCTVRRDMSRLEVDLQTISAVIRDGGILHRLYNDFPKNKFGFAIEPIEVDRLDQYFNRPASGDSNEIQFSIEMDRWHGPVAFWILTRHPGDVYVSWSGGQKYREQVPAEKVIAIFDIRTRGGQYVGISRFASIIQAMHRLEQFDLAHVTAAIWASCKPFFIIQEYPTAIGEYAPDFVRKMVEGNQDQGIGDGEGEKLSNVEPGTGEVLPYGQKPMLVDPRFPVEAASEFKKDQLRKMAAGSGVPYFLIAQDWGAINFSSGRLGLNAFHDTCKVLQSHLIKAYRRPHFNAWLNSYLLSGNTKLPYSRLAEFQKAAHFHGRTWPYVQPMDDAQSDIMLIEAGIKPRDQVIRERGGKGVEETNAQFASDRASDKSHGLDFSAIEKPTIAKGQVGNPQDDDKAGAPANPAANGNGNGKARFAVV